MHFSFSEETYTKKRAWGNSEISILKCVPELSLGRRPFLVGDRQCVCGSLLLVCAIWGGGGCFFFPFLSFCQRLWKRYFVKRIIFIYSSVNRFYSKAVKAAI